MAQLLILTSAVDTEVLPALGLLSHTTKQIPASPASLITAPACDLIFVDARQDLASAKSLCKILTTTGVTVPLILILTEGGLTAVSADWGVDDVLLVSAGPAEADARIRLALGRQAQESSSSKIQASGVVIDEASYSAKVHGRPLDLTFKEFELLRNPPSPRPSLQPSNAPNSTQTLMLHSPSSSFHLLWTSLNCLQSLRCRPPRRSRLSLPNQEHPSTTPRCLP